MKTAKLICIMFLLPHTMFSQAQTTYTRKTVYSTDFPKGTTVTYVHMGNQNPAPTYSHYTRNSGSSSKDSTTVDSPHDKKITRWGTVIVLGLFVIVTYLVNLNNP